MSLEELQKDLDDYLQHYNHERTHQGKMCCGRTPWITFLDGKKLWEEKNISGHYNYDRAAVGPIKRPLEAAIESGHIPSKEMLTDKKEISIYVN